jgi:CBS domain-containing protein
MTESLHRPGDGGPLVEELMSNPVCTVSKHESLLMAWELLERSGFQHLPVVREDGRCVGVLDRAEVAVACAAPAAALSRRRVDVLLRGRCTPSVHSDDPLRRAAAVMTRSGADALPVTDPSGCLIGLLTARDIVAAVSGEARPNQDAGRVDLLMAGRAVPAAWAAG